MALGCWGGILCVEEKDLYEELIGQPAYMWDRLLESRCVSHFLESFREEFEASEVEYTYRNLTLLPMETGLPSRALESCS